MSVNHHLNHSPLVVRHPKALNSLHVKPCSNWQTMVGTLLSDGRGGIVAAVVKGRNRSYSQKAFFETGAWCQPHLLSGVLCDVLLLHTQLPQLDNLCQN